MATPNSSVVSRCSNMNCSSESSAVDCCCWDWGLSSLEVDWEERGVLCIDMREERMLEYSLQ
jgi:hypothetical protein